jgi:hypothetical protein
MDQRSEGDSIEELTWRCVLRLTPGVQATYALNRGDVFEAYQLYLQAGLHSAAHELAVFELAPEAVIRDDLELVKTLFDRFTGHAVDEWHVRGKVRKTTCGYATSNF